MCGIAGAIDNQGISSKETDLIREMNARQRHRGPDDQGVFEDAGCILGHRRLAIIDLSQDGRQPFSSDDGRYQMVYNGEIYNYIELREGLKRLGWEFRTRTDTEVLLKMFLQHGSECLPMLNGMFAFAVYDKLAKRMFLARDRVGIKPLYYTQVRSTLYFASEIKALLLIPGLDRAFNNQSLFDYLVFSRTDVFEETFFSSIKRIPNGHYAVYETDHLTLTRWWHPENYLRENMEEQPERISQRIEEILESAVRLRMRSDVSVGSCLSGGLDSSILVGMLYNCRLADEEYKTYTACFPGHPVDESRYVDSLNRQYPFQNMRTYPTAEKALDRLKAFVFSNDEPTTTPCFFSQYQVMELARENGTVVLLDGQGGDENFAGYPYLHGFNLYGLFKMGAWLSLGREVLQVIHRRQDKSAFQTFGFQVLPDGLRKKLLLKTLPYVSPDFFYAYIDSSRIYNDFFDANDLNQSLAKHFQYKLEHLLRMEDRNSMAFSIEARVPYLDYRLIEYVLGVSGSCKIKGGETKWIQKKALGKYTIPEIVDRKDKIGFGTPGEDWMRTKAWQEMTKKSFKELIPGFPGVFVSGKPIPFQGFDRWKINQLAAWREVFAG